MPMLATHRRERFAQLLAQGHVAVAAIREMGVLSGQRIERREGAVQPRPNIQIGGR